MCTEALATICRLRIATDDARAPLMESALGIKLDVAVSEDDARNERSSFDILFSEECGPYFQNIYVVTMKRMSVMSFAEARVELILLAFLQEVISAALWKYGLRASESLENFAREFDRLDIESERRRLYERAVKDYDLGRRA